MFSSQLTGDSTRVRGESGSTPGALSGKNGRWASEKGILQAQNNPTQRHSPLTKSQNHMPESPEGCGPDVFLSPCSGHRAAGQATSRTRAGRWRFLGAAWGPCGPWRGRPACRPQPAARPSDWCCRRIAPGAASKGEWGPASGLHLRGVYQAPLQAGRRDGRWGITCTTVSKTQAALPGPPPSIRKET